MNQYIDKSALLAEIERRKHKLLDTIICERDKEWVVRTAHQLNRIILFLDTLEVKEVNCDKEIGMYTTKELLWKRNKVTNVFHLTQGDIDRIAKHFFELGLKVKGE